MLDVAEQTDKPLAVLSNLGSAIDQNMASQLREAGVPVFEGTRSGLVALRHLLAHAHRAVANAAAGESAESGKPDAVGSAAPRPGRRAHGAALLARGEASGAELLELLAEYGIDGAQTRPAADLDAALAAAEAIGYPIVLKTGDPQILHKSDVGGVLVGIAGPSQLAAAYADLAGRLGSRVLVSRAVPAGVELALGIVADPELGPLVVVGAGGVLVELLSDRAVALPPVSATLAAELLAGLRVRTLLDGARGAPPADIDVVIRAVCGLSDLAVELGDQLAALDINPLICGPHGAIAVDALAVSRRR
jgi:acyl-CoA synthetase (NDP forming)